VVPVVEGLRRRGAGPLSIDTFKAEAARAALEAGADIVNDVSGYRNTIPPWPDWSPNAAARRW